MSNAGIYRVTQWLLPPQIAPNVNVDYPEYLGGRLGSEALSGIKACVFQSQWVAWMEPRWVNAVLSTQFSIEHEREVEIPATYNGPIRRKFRFIPSKSWFRIAATHHSPAGDFTREWKAGDVLRYDNQPKGPVHRSSTGWKADKNLRRLRRLLEGLERTGLPPSEATWAFGPAYRLRNTLRHFALIKTQRLQSRKRHRRQ